MHDDMQRAFLAAVRGAAPQVALGTSTIPWEVTWEIYGRNYLEGHIGALADTFGTVRAVIGLDCLRSLAKQYVVQAHSVSGDLNDYGLDFPDFLSTSQISETLPYLGDVARLDWAWLVTLRAAHHAGNWLQQLVSLPPDAWPGALARPAGIVLTSRFPIYSIFRLHAEDGPTVNLDCGGQTILISRTDAVVVTLLTDAEAACVTSWFAGNTLGAAMDAGLAVDEQFDISALLRRLTAVGALQSIESNS